jgi:hypothetical protein
MNNEELKNQLTVFGKWLGENNFGRNSFGVWSTNISSFKRMDDSEIVDMYLHNPNEREEAAIAERKKILDIYEAEHGKNIN